MASHTLTNHYYTCAIGKSQSHEVRHQALSLSLSLFQCLFQREEREDKGT